MIWKVLFAVSMAINLLLMLVVTSRPAPPRKMTLEELAAIHEESKASGRREAFKLMAEQSTLTVEELLALHDQRLRDQAEASYYQTAESEIRRQRRENR